MKDYINDTWVTKDGSEIHVTDMTDEHLKNTYYFCARLYDENKCNGIPKAIAVEMRRRGFLPIYHYIERWEMDKWDRWEKDQY